MKMRAKTKAAGMNMYITARHMSRKKLPSFGSLRRALMIAQRPLKPMAADRKSMMMSKKIWLKFDRCTSPAQCWRSVFVMNEVTA